MPSSQRFFHNSHCEVFFVRHSHPFWAQILASGSHSHMLLVSSITLILSRIHLNLLSTPKPWRKNSILLLTLWSHSYLPPFRFTILGERWKTMNSLIVKPSLLTILIHFGSRYSTYTTGHLWLIGIIPLLIANQWFYLISMYANNKFPRSIWQLT